MVSSFILVNSSGLQKVYNFNQTLFQKLPLFKYKYLNLIVVFYSQNYMNWTKNKQFFYESQQKHAPDEIDCELTELTNNTTIELLTKFFFPKVWETPDVMFFLANLEATGGLFNVRFYVNPVSCENWQLTCDWVDQKECILPPNVICTQKLAAFSSIASCPKNLNKGPI